MFDNTNYYQIRVDETGYSTHYFVSFTDGQADLQETEVSFEVYNELCKFVKIERNLRRSDERHIEQFDLTEGTLHNRALYPGKNVEDIVSANLSHEKLHKAIMKLSPIQRRRVTLYYFNGLTFAQIAERERCSHPAIIKSIKEAMKKIKQLLED